MSYEHHTESDGWAYDDEWGDDRPMMFVVERPWLWLAVSTSALVAVLAVAVVVALGVFG